MLTFVVIPANIWKIVKKFILFDKNNELGNLILLRDL